jgi:enoyl-CoA hydratase/carnithine racemase
MSAIRNDGYATLRVERRGPAGIVTLNRPDVLNALSGQLYRELDAAISDLTHKGTRALIVTGAPRLDGRACFCAGADLKDPDLEQGPYLARQAFLAIERSPLPSIAAIGGVAVGGGLELALACDFRIVAASAKLGLPEVNIGTMPRAGGTQRLAALIGSGRAKELLMLGEFIDGVRAAQIGMVTRCVAEGAELDEALALAATLSAKAPLALAAIKRAVNQSRDLTLEAGLDLEIREGEALDRTDDRAEGRRAFLEKRPPIYRGS